MRRGAGHTIYATHKNRPNEKVENESGPVPLLPLLRSFNLLYAFPLTSHKSKDRIQFIFPVMRGDNRDLCCQTPQDLC